MRHIVLCGLLLACNKHDSDSKGGEPKIEVATLTAAIYGTADPSTDGHRIAHVAVAGTTAVVLGDGGAVGKLDLAAKAYAPLPPNAPEAAQEGIALSPDGKHVVLVGRTPLLDGKPLVLPDGYWVMQVAYAPNGNLVALASGKSIDDGPAPMQLLTFDPAGKKTAEVKLGSVPEDDDKCRLVIAGSGDVAILTSCYETHAVRIRDGARLALFPHAGLGHDIGVAEVQPGLFAIGHVSEHPISDEDPEVTVAFPGEDPHGKKLFGDCELAPTGRVFACGDAEEDHAKVTHYRITIRDTGKKLAERARVELPAEARTIAFTPDGNTVIAGLYNGQVAVLDIAAIVAGTPPVAVAKSAKPITANVPVAADAPEKPVTPVKTLAFDEAPLSTIPSPDGKLVAVITADGTEIVDAVKGTKLRTVETGVSRGKPVHIAWSPDGTHFGVANAGEVETVEIIGTGAVANSTEKKLATELKEPPIAWSPDGKWLATGGKEYGTIAIWDVASGGKARDIVPKKKQWLGGLAFGGDGKLLSWGDWEATSLWDVETGKLVGELEGHLGSIVTAAFSPDGTRLATGGRDETVIVWDMKTRTPLQQLHTRDLAFAMAWSPDGAHLAIIDRRDGIGIWRVADGKPVVTLVAKTIRPDDFAWLGTSLIVGVSDGLGWFAVPKL